MRLLLSLLLMCSLTSFAAPTAPKILHNSQQLLLVIAPDWNTTNATLQRYQRNPTSHQWSAVGEPVAVVVGKNGLGWGAPFQSNDSADPQKKEGDLRAPAGIFKLGTAFGFASEADPEMKMKYLPLKETTFCVDDKNSTYYNQVIDTANISHPDWQPGTGEQMRKVSLYEMGAVVQYNAPHPVQGSGSCIFMHIWRAPNSGTAGCIAMAKANLKEVLDWANPTQNPVIAILPQETYNQLKSKWNLP